MVVSLSGELADHWYIPTFVSSVKIWPFCSTCFILRNTNDLFFISRWLKASIKYILIQLMVFEIYLWSSVCRFVDSLTLIHLLSSIQQGKAMRKGQWAGGAPARPGASYSTRPPCHSLQNFDLKPPVRYAQRTVTWWCRTEALRAAPALRQSTPSPRSATRQQSKGKARQSARRGDRPTSVKFSGPTQNFTNQKTCIVSLALV